MAINSGLIIIRTLVNNTLLICTTITKYKYIMLGEKVFISKHGETIITILNVVMKIIINKKIICTQWRNVTIWCPPADFFAAPHKFFTVSKKKKKKGCHFFFCFSYRLLAPLKLFVPPNIFFASTER